MAVREHECDNCGHVAQGYQKAELETQGWIWHVATKGYAGIAETYFVMCDGCTGAAERRVQDRRDRERRASVPQTSCSHCHADTMVLPAPAVVVGTDFNRALPTALCRGCDKYPVSLRRVEYTDADWSMPDFFFPEPS